MIPLSTTTIAILRTPAGDAYDEPYSGTALGERTTVASGIRAVIDKRGNQPGGREQVAGGEQGVADVSLVCDPCDLTHTDLVLDERSNITYTVLWVINYGPQVEAGLRNVRGVI